jgi:UDP-N-acetylglucosamine 2-epimerase (non-hydrolysing)
MVGNIMIDSMEMMRERIEAGETYRTFGLEEGGYGVVTLHRPSNVDDRLVLKKIAGILREIAEMIPLVFPIHPRTRKNLEENHLLETIEGSGRLYLPEPLGYINFMNLVFNSRLVITDSGGIQEETSYLGIPCLTLRKNTERPVTVTHGTNQLCELDHVRQKTRDIIKRGAPAHNPIELWDGKTAGRIVDILRVISFRGVAENAEIRTAGGVA